MKHKPSAKTRNEVLNICPIPTVVLRFEFAGAKDESKHRTDRAAMKPTESEAGK